MKRFMIAASLTLLVAGTAMAQSASTLNAGRLFVQPNATFAAGAPTTTNNDDSCDIAVMPAATLLLPYFEVDFRSPAASAQTTLFTITNTSNLPQIAHVTVWTDWSFPVLDFNIFLTGYDVQSINLYDLLSRGTFPATGFTNSPRGSRSTLSGASGAGPFAGPGSAPVLGSTANPAGTLGNPNFAPGAGTACDTTFGSIGSLLADVQSALTTGRYSLCGPLQVGSSDHGPNAVGYITIDVANTCSQTLPTTASYYQNEILFDNTLTGDYQRVNPTATTGNYAGGESLVHIRAIPEGGLATSNPGTNLPYTFYDRYTPTAQPALDRRQPLPGLFAARFIAGGAGNFDTRLAIWREGYLNGAETESCVGLDENANIIVGPLSGVTAGEIVRFDERENPTTNVPGCRVSPCLVPTLTLPETSARRVTDTTTFPIASGSADVAGWLYLNLNNGGDDDYSRLQLDGTRPRGVASRNTSQNWVTVQFTAEGRYGVDFDATMLGNGCSPNPGTTTSNNGLAGAPGGAIGPAPNVTPR